MRTSLHALLLLSTMAASGPAFAQEHGDASHATDAAHGDDASHGTAKSAAGHGDATKTGHGDGHAPATAHGANPGAGHGDAHGEGHGDAHGEGHGDAHHVDYAADADGDGTPNWRDSDSDGYVVIGIVQHAFNLFLLLAILFVFARKPVQDALHRRASHLRQGITDAARAKDEAQTTFDAISARLDAFEGEVAKMRSSAEADAKAEEARLVERANEEAIRIADSADKTISSELNRARMALRDDAVKLAVQLAENTLKAQVQAADQQLLARQFLDALKQDGAHHG